MLRALTCFGRIFGGFEGFGVGSTKKAPRTVFNPHLDIVHMSLQSKYSIAYIQYSYRSLWLCARYAVYGNHCVEKAIPNTTNTQPAQARHLILLLVHTAVPSRPVCRVSLIPLLLLQYYSRVWSPCASCVPAVRCVVCGGDCDAGVSALLASFRRL